MNFSEVDLEKDVVEPLSLVQNVGSIVILDTQVSLNVYDLAKKYANSIIIVCVIVYSLFLIEIHFMCASAPGTTSFSSLYGGNFSISIFQTLSSPYCHGKNIQQIQKELIALCATRFSKIQTPFFSDPCKTFEDFCFVTCPPLQLCQQCSSLNIHRPAIYNCLEYGCKLALCEIHATKHKNHSMVKWKDDNCEIIKQTQ